MLSRTTLVLFANLVQHTDLSYNENAKRNFHKRGKRVLADLAELLGLEPGTFDIRSNMGGIAVSGEVTLHGENIYVQFSQVQCLGPALGFMYRSCKGRKDYSGGRNQWMKWDQLIDLPLAAEKISEVMRPMFEVR